MENNINIKTLNPKTFEYSDYTLDDKNLIVTNELVNKFNEVEDYIEFFIYSENKTLISPTSNFVLKDFNIKQENIHLNPSKNLEDLGYGFGTYNIFYNFFKKRISSDFNNKYFIKEISSDRTELRLDSNIIDNEDIISSVNNFINYREESQDFIDFFLNFGSNQTIIANNIKLDIVENEDPTVLIKLYNPLPPEFGIKHELWVVEEISEPKLYEVEFIFNPLEEQDFEYISGPNFTLDVKNLSNDTTEEHSYSTLLNSNISSSNSQISNIIKNKGIEVNINYEDFNEFVHFSSIKTRLENFTYKLKLLESIDVNISELSSSINNQTGSIYIENQNQYEVQKSQIIKNFDGYEKFLYNTSGSQYTYPKSNTEYPYTLYNSNSPTVINWLEFITPIVEDFDNNNPNLLKYTIPEYLREDPENLKYELFIDMVGQHYDNIWVYTKNISNRFSGDNRLNYGISKDLVQEAIKDFGVNLYTNNFNINDLYSSFLGINTNGSTFPYPNMSSNLPSNIGNEYVDTYITSSNQPIPLKNLDNTIYKRIYHNIPLLLKTKGTLRGLRSLITSYGIPDYILNPNEFITTPIKIQNNNLPQSPFDSDTENEILTHLRPLQQKETGSKEFNKNYSEVGFSIQDNINADISSSLGNIELGEYIGDPRQIYDSNLTYTDLDNLRETFYSTYQKTKRVKDFIRIVKFFDNSLFKMIKDFTPSNMSLSSGVIVKQHILERNKQKHPNLLLENKTYETQVQSFPYNYQLKPLLRPQGGTGGMFEKFNGLQTTNSASAFGLNNRYHVTQSYNESIVTPFGTVLKLIYDQNEFYDGEFSGSNIIVTDQNLNPNCDPYKKFPVIPLFYNPYFFNTKINNITGGTVTSGGWSDPNNSPSIGDIWILSKVNDLSDDDLNNSNDTVYDIIKLKIAISDNNGNNLNNYLNTSLEKVELNFNNKSFQLFVSGIELYSNYAEISIDSTQGEYQFTDNNLRYLNGVLPTNVTDSDLGERGSKNYIFSASGDFRHYEPSSPLNSQNEFLSGGIGGGPPQFIQYYNNPIYTGSCDENIEYGCFNLGNFDFTSSDDPVPLNYGTYHIKQTPNIPLKFSMKVNYSASNTGFTSTDFSGLYHYHLDDSNDIQSLFFSSTIIDDFSTYTGSFYPRSYPNFTTNQGGLDPSIFDLLKTSNLTPSNQYIPDVNIVNGSPLLLYSGSADLNFTTQGLKYYMGARKFPTWADISGSSLSNTNPDITGSEYPQDTEIYTYDSGDLNGVIVFNYGNIFNDFTSPISNWNKNLGYNLTISTELIKDPSHANDDVYYSIFWAVDNSKTGSTPPLDEDYQQYNYNIHPQSMSPPPTGTVDQPRKEEVNLSIGIIGTDNIKTFIFPKDWFIDKSESLISKFYFKIKIERNKEILYKVNKYKVDFIYNIENGITNPGDDPIIDDPSDPSQPTFSDSIN